jgi:GTPase SAR1 family protein
MVYDVSVHRTYESLERWQRQMQETCYVDEMPFIILGNKSDKDAKVNPETVERHWIKTGRAHAHFVTSVTDHRSIEIAFERIA